MVYIRGNRADYDGWAAMGHDGWGWEDVLPYFLRAEDNERGASELHGAGGPLSVIDNRSRYRTCEAFIEAGQQAGLARQRRLQRPPSRTASAGIRSPSETGCAARPRSAYLHPVLGRPNLDLITGRARHPAAARRDDARPGWRSTATAS